MKYSIEEEKLIRAKYPVSGSRELVALLGRNQKSIIVKAIALGLSAPRPLKTVTSHRAHSSWRQMIHRCLNPKRPSYKSYGLKGVGVCDRWKDFWLFLEDMGERPEGFSIDRIDPSKSYQPDNCRWIPRSEQKHTTRAALGIGQPKTGSPCMVCKERPFVRKMRCHRCSEYYRRKGVERPCKKTI